MIEIFLPDSSSKSFEKAPTGLELAQSIGQRLAQDAVGIKIKGQSEIQDLRLTLNNNDRVEIITLKSPEANEVIRHSAAHVMAQAVQKLWPEVKVTIGPVIENGFYYDFDSKITFSEDDFEKIESEMQKIISANISLTRQEWPIDQAIQTFSKMNETYKVEIIEGLKNDGNTVVSIYHQGDWFDLCRGPHVQSTGQIKAFKLLSVAGAYWRGDEKNPMLQRIYATAFKDKKELQDYLYQIEEAKKRDHRKLGKELDLFYFHPWAPGSPFFTGKGAIIYTELQTYLRQLYFKYGYQEVITPQIFDTELFKTSGHYENYKENMYFLNIDEREFSSKPMNCPSHCLLYQTQKHSYRELPWRIADFGRLHRYERAGTMHGLTRVRTFCQDDAHIFCRLDQLLAEIKGFMSLLKEVYQTLGMDEFNVYLSTRPEKRMGSDQVWDQSEGSLKQALEALNIPYTVNAGDGAFYGPKLDIMFVDALKRPWQLGTLQVDYNLPEAFKLTYTGEDNLDHRPVMLHRAILGSLERFIGVYLEHTAGHLPAWLSPVQAVLLNVTDRVNEYCHELESQLRALGIRVEFDQRNEKLNYKIRQAQLLKIPYMIVIGDQELEKREVTIRLRSGENMNNVPIDSAIQLIMSDIKNKNMKPNFQQEVSH